MLCERFYCAFWIYEDIEHYGEQTAYELGLEAGVVLQLCSTLKAPEKTRIFEDNFFSGINLLRELSKKKIGFIESVKEKRLAKGKLRNEKEIKRERIGTIYFSVASIDNLYVIGWKCFAYLYFIIELCRSYSLSFCN